jgi:hypothetical protein
MLSNFKHINYTQASLQPTKVANELPIRLNLLINYLLFLIPIKVSFRLTNTLFSGIFIVNSIIFGRIKSNITIPQFNTIVYSWKLFITKVILLYTLINLSGLKSRLQTDKLESRICKFSLRLAKPPKACLDYSTSSMNIINY